MPSKKTTFWILTLLFLALAGSIGLPLWRGVSPINLGLDLAGGVVVTYRPDFSSRLDTYADLSQDQLLELAKETLKSRLYRHSSSVPDVVVRGDQRIVVSLPSREQGNDLLGKIGKTYHLTFRLVEASFTEERAKPDHAEIDLYPYRGRFLQLAAAQFSGDMLDERAIRVASPQAGLEGLQHPSALVEFEFRPPFDDAFAAFTERHIGREMAILLDENVEWSGVIESAIHERGVLRGAYNLEEASEVAMLLRSGSLPISLEVESLTAIGPSLGQAVKEEGWRALGLALGGLFLILLIAYQHRSWFLLTGLASLLCLLGLIFSLVATFRLTLDLVGIAGLILSIGMGMDAFILVFEALEERLALDKAIQHPPRIVRAIYGFASEGGILLHANATTLLVISLLFATERLKSFATFILVGILASLLTILITRHILQRGSFPQPNRPDLFRWMRQRQWDCFRWRQLYLGLVLIAAISLSWSLLRTEGTALSLGKDFQAGTQVIVNTPQDAALDRALKKLESTFPDLETKRQTLGEKPDGRYLLTLGKPLRALAESSGITGPSQIDKPSEFTISPEDKPPRQSFDVSMLARLFLQHGIELESVESIDSRVSSRRLLGSLTVLLVSFFFLALYFVLVEEPLDRIFGSRVTYRTRPSAKGQIFTGVFLAVLGDLVIVLAFLAFRSIPISLAVVAGLLTVVGYSVNDSVVLWRHAHKFWSKHPHQSAEKTVSHSIDRLLSRAVLTSLSTMVPALSILLVDLEPLRDFAWVILIGTSAGTLSSLFLVGIFAVGALKDNASVIQISTAREI